VSSRGSEQLGAFPLRGPITYLHLTATEVREALLGLYPATTTWFHQTAAAEAASAAWQGLIPSCWVGGDGCCVFGDDRRQPASPYRGDWILEIQSPALPEQQKAWWVPAAQVVGAWHDDVFYSAAELRELGSPLLSPTGTCACDLADLVGKQVALWRTTFASDA
jgi:hypothetical protein